MTGFTLTESSIEFLNSLLLTPLLVLAILLLYRLNRIFEYGEESAESLEKTAKNVENSTETVDDAVSLLRRVPFVGGDDD